MKKLATLSLISGALAIALATPFVGHAEESGSNSKIEAIAKILGLQVAKILQLEHASPRIGSVQMSFLSEQQFQAINGQGWVLCDGRTTWSRGPISESRYGKLTQKEAVPDCTDRFFRFGNGQEVAIHQDQATAVNGLNLLQTAIGGTFQSNTAGNHNHGMSGSGSHSHGMSSAGDHHHMQQGVYPGKGGPVGSASRTYARGGTFGQNVNTQNSGSHRHSIHSAGAHSHGIHHSGNHNHTVRIDLPHSHRLIGNQETRPKNISLNVFVRVN